MWMKIFEIWSKHGNFVKVGLWGFFGSEISILSSVFWNFCKILEFCQILKILVNFSKFDLSMGIASNSVSGGFGGWGFRFWYPFSDIFCRILECCQHFRNFMKIFKIWSNFRNFVRFAFCSFSVGNFDHGMAWHDHGTIMAWHEIFWNFRDQSTYVGTERCLNYNWKALHEAVLDFSCI